MTHLTLLLQTIKTPFEIFEFILAKEYLQFEGLFFKVKKTRHVVEEGNRGTLSCIEISVMLRN